MKREFFKFRYYDFNAIEQHLSDMAARGYQLSSAGNYFWQYEECPPENMKYCLQYKKEDISILTAYTGDSEEEKSAHVAAEEMDWVFVDTINNMRIYCTRNLSAEPLEKDDIDRFNAIEKITYKSYVIAYAILVVCMLVLGFMNISNLWKYPLDAFASTSGLIADFMIVFALIILTASILQCVLWVEKSKRSLKKGNGYADPHTRTYQIMDLLTYIFTGICVIGFLISGSGDGDFSTIVYFICFAALIIALNVWNGHQKKKKASKKKIILSTVLTFFIIFGVLMALDFVVFEKDLFDKSGSDYENLPVTVEDFGRECTNPEIMYYCNSSPILTTLYGEQYGDDGDNISYSVSRLNNMKHYDWFFKKALMEDIYMFQSVIPVSLDVDEFWKETSDSSWNTDRVYEGEEFDNSWVLGAGEYIIKINTSWTPSDSEKKELLTKLINAVK